MLRSLIFIFSFVFSLSSYAQLAPYQDGVHYYSIDGNETVQREVREYFSVFCPTCASFERFMPTIKENLPKGMSLNRTHVDFLSMASVETQSAMTKAYVYAEQNGFGDEFLKKAFSRIHIEKKRPTSPEEVFGILFEFEEVKEKDFYKGSKGNIADIEASAMRVEQDILAENGVLKGVPTFIVNNKYVIELRELNRQNPILDLTKLIAYLDGLK